MPTRTCEVCGRIVIVAPPSGQPAQEVLRCPRCGSRFDVERRTTEQPQNRRRRDERASPDER